MNRCCHSPLPLLTKPLKVKMCSKKGSQQVRIFNSVATPFSKKHIAGHSPQFEKDKLSQGESNCDDDGSGPLFSMYVKMVVEEDRIMADSLKADADRVLICHDPSHGGFYMAEGVFYIRIGLPPRVVSGDCLVLSLYGLMDCYLCCLRAHVRCPMSSDLGVVLVHFTYFLIMHVGTCSHGTLYPMTGCVLYWC